MIASYHLMDALTVMGNCGKPKVVLPKAEPLGLKVALGSGLPRKPFQQANYSLYFLMGQWF